MIKSAVRNITLAFMMVAGFIAGAVFTLIALIIAGACGFHALDGHRGLVAFVGGLVGSWLVRRGHVQMEEGRGSAGVASDDFHRRHAAGEFDDEIALNEKYPNSKYWLSADDPDYAEDVARIRARKAGDGGARRTASKRPIGPIAPGFFVPSMKVYGKIGGTMADADFSAANVGAGLKGEMMTSKIVEDIIAENDARIYLFRGLSWPGSKNADIDFIIATVRYTGGRKDLDIWMVDAKLWKKGHYTWDGTMCYRDGEPYHEIKFENAIAGVRELFPGARVHADVVIHGASGVSNQVGSSAMHIITPADFTMRVRALSRGSLIELDTWTGKRLSGMVKVPLR